MKEFLKKILGIKSKEKKYILITSEKRGPCINVKNHLDAEFPKWEDFVEVLDVTEITLKEWFDIKQKYKISFTPTMVELKNKKTIFSGYNPFIINGLIKLLKK
jgi:hypothetical protein